MSLYQGFDTNIYRVVFLICYRYFFRQVGIISPRISELVSASITCKVIVF